MKNLFYLPGKCIPIFLISSLAFLAVTACTKKLPVDRHSLVTRHNVKITSPDSLSSLSVGNGDFAVTLDITGLQTFPDFHERGILLGTMSNRGWHTWDNPECFSLEDVYKTYEVHGRRVNYVHQFRRNEDSARFSASEWLRNNPHRIHLGLIGLRILNKEGKKLEIGGINEPVQPLNLWSGRISSRFLVEGVPVSVETVCHPDMDIVSAKVSSSRSGLAPDPHWDDVIDKLSILPVQNGLYLCSEDMHDSYENRRYLSDHPIVSAVSGILPVSKMVDRIILSGTLDTIMAKWNWQSTWGWDFPLLAMSAASVGRPSQAIDFLMMDAPKNRYPINGHNYQDSRLALYLPGNGGLLTAVAKMCVEKQFPADETWNVRFENLNKYPE